MIGTLIGIGLALAGAQAATSVIGGIKAGNASNKAAEAATVAGTAAATQAIAVGTANRSAAYDEAGISEYNASVAAAQAQDALDRGAIEEAKYRTQVRGLIGSQRAGFAASGVDVSYGSAVDVQADAAYLGELDALTIRTNAAREAWGYKVTSGDFSRQASIQRKAGDNSAITADYNAQAVRAGAQSQADSARANANAAYLGAAGSFLAGGTSLLQMKYGFGKH